VLCSSPLVTLPSRTVLEDAISTGVRGENREKKVSIDRLVREGREREPWVNNYIGTHHKETNHPFHKDKQLKL
jgi:hypothetical protein